MLSTRGGYQCAILLGSIVVLTVIASVTAQVTTSFSSSGSGISTISIAAVSSGNTALDNQDYTAALLYFNQAINANADNGEAYLGRAQVELLLDEPSQAEQDARQAAQLLRQSSICDAYLPQDSPLLLVSSDSSTLTTLNYSTLGTILNPSSTTSLTSTLLPTGSTDTSTTTSATGTATNTSGTTSASSTDSTATSTSGTSSSSLGTTSTSTATALNTSASGSQKLPVSDDITTRESAQNNAKNQYYQTVTEQNIYLTVCAAVYHTNEAKLVKAYTIMGMAALSAGDYTTAQNAFNAVLFLKSDSGIGHAGLGLVYLSQGSSSAALTELNLGVQDDPTDPDVYIARGGYWAKIEDTNRAQEDFQTALQLDPNSARAYNAMGVIATQQGNYQVGIDYYTKALAINSYYVVVYYNRATAWKALAEQTTDTSLAFQYNQNATKDTEKATSLQNVVTSSTTTTTSSATTDTTSSASVLAF